MANLAATLQAMTILLAIALLLIGALVGFVAGVRNADSKKLKAAAEAASAVKKAVKTVSE